MLVKFEQNRIVQTTQNFELLMKKQVFYNHFRQRVDAILEDISVAKFIVKCYAFNLKTIIFQCSKKLRHSDTCNQVQSCTKHGRPDQTQQELTVALNVYVCIGN